MVDPSGGSAARSGSSSPDASAAASPVRHGPRERSGSGAGSSAGSGPPLAAIAAFLAKFKSIILLAPKLKLLTTFGTMGVSLAAYAWIWGVPFAAGFVVLLFVHEMGHVIALRREGIKASPPMFIPFLGAVITSRSLGDNALAEARVGLAGPVLGSIGAAACILIWHATGNDIWRALAYTGFLLNLFNLLPGGPARRRPGDGGDGAVDVVRWVRGADPAGVRVHQPDHPAADPDRRP